MRQVASATIAHRVGLAVLYTEAMDRAVLAERVRVAALKALRADRKRATAIIADFIEDPQLATRLTAAILAEPDPRRPR